MDISSPPACNPRLEIERRKAEKEAEEASNYTFSPKIKNQSPATKQNKELIERDERDSQKSSFDRLYVDAMKRHVDSKIKEQVNIKPGDEELTFKPKFETRSTSRNSSKSLSRSSSASRSISSDAHGDIDKSLRSSSIDR